MLQVAACFMVKQDVKQDTLLQKPPLTSVKQVKQAELHCRAKPDTQGESTRLKSRDRHGHPAPTSNGQGPTRVHRAHGQGYPRSTAPTAGRDGLPPIADWPFF